jgi:nickel transport protein
MTKKKGSFLAVLAVFLLSLAVPAAAYGHGVKITYQSKTVVEVTALYETGEPMAGAQVTVYAPGDPSTPWLTGACDQNGRFTFTPEPSKPGTWDVQVRQAGHGGIVHIPVGESVAETGGGTYTPLQTVLMVACVLWGLVGTALFFAGRKG